MMTMFTIFFVLIALMLIFMVIITPSQEGGLASAFGGMGSDSFFGTKAGRHINRFTVFLAVTFIVLAMAINYMNMGRTAGDGGGKFDPGPAAPPTEQAPPPGSTDN